MQAKEGRLAGMAGPQLTSQFGNWGTEIFILCLLSHLCYSIWNFLHKPCVTAIMYRLNCMAGALDSVSSIHREGNSSRSSPEVSSRGLLMPGPPAPVSMKEHHCSQSKCFYVQQMHEHLWVYILIRNWNKGQTAKLGEAKNRGGLGCISLCEFSGGKQAVTVSGEFLIVQWTAQWH